MVGKFDGGGDGSLSEGISVRNRLSPEGAESCDHSISSTSKISKAI